MKKFLTKIAMYVALVFLIGNLIILVCIKIWPNQVVGDNKEYFMWNYMKKKSSVKHLEPTNVILGDSRPLAGMDPTILKHNFNNFAIGGSTSFEEYFVFKKYASINTVDTLVVSFSPLKMGGHDGSFDERTLPFNFATRAELDSLEKIEKNVNQTIDNKVPDNFYLVKRALIEKHFPPYFRATFYDAIIGILFDNDGDRIRQFKKELDETGHCFYGRHDSDANYAFEVTRSKPTDSFKVNKICLAYLDSMWYLCKQKNIKMIFVVSPVNLATYKKVYNSPYFTQYNSFVNSLPSRYPGLTLINKYLVLDNKYFGDPNHLNQRGSKLFSNYLLNELYGGSSGVK